jgi:hypothetical protein
VACRAPYAPIFRVMVVAEDDGVGILELEGYIAFLCLREGKGQQQQGALIVLIMSLPLVAAAVIYGIECNFFCH